MICPRPVSLALLALFLALPGCASSGNEEAGDPTAGDEDDLINGKVAGDGDFRPTLLINNACTATKVGPRRILTAAHCVTGANYLESGQQLMIHTANAVTDKTALTLARYAVIESVRVHPNYDPTKHMSDAPDVAVIVIKGTTIDDVPSALVDLDPVALGSKVTINGYGCPVVMLGGGTGDHTLRFATTTTVAASTVGLPYSDAMVSLIDQNFVVTPGPAIQGDAAGVCPGDSGGPVYRTGKSKLTVAAVNSWTSGGSIAGPKANMLVRLHEGSRHSVGEWLSQQGVRLSRPCKNTKRCTGPIAAVP